jgi:pSer/pThr/pTyr-binding forkhead associated (FHA) protein
VKKGVKVSKPVYYAQVNLYMHHLDLAENPALFTAINGDTGEIYAELIPFDPENVQQSIDRGARVVSTASPEEAPRIAKDSTFFKCKFCSYRLTCWAEAKAAAPAQAGGWWGGA